MTTVMQRLKEATAETHKTTEINTVMTALLKEPFDYDVYRDVLRRFHVVHRAADPHVVQGLTQHRLTYAYSDKLSWLERDMQRANVTPDPVEVAWGPMASLEEILGTVYVMEGKTLGGMLIHKWLHRNGVIATASTRHFFNPYGRKVKARWNETGAFIEETIVTRGLDVERTLKAANDVFVKIRSCLV